MLITVPAVLLLFSLTGIAYIVNSRWPQLKQLDVDLLMDEKNQQVKLTLLEERLKRRLGAPLKQALGKLKPSLKHVFHLTVQAYQFLAVREKNLRTEAQKLSFRRRPVHERQGLIQDKLLKADQADDKKDLETSYLDILSLDPRNLEAYDGLARLYQKQRDYVHAREIFEHILKLGSYKIEHYIGLAEALQATDQAKRSLVILKQAQRLQPRNPKLVDKIVETAILLKDSATAKDYLSRLREINPENQKLEEYKQAIREL